MSFLIEIDTEGLGELASDGRIALMRLSGDIFSQTIRIAGRLIFGFKS